jgi:Zn finger protein HypA/HybF involved in hydrogenase expression
LKKQDQPFVDPELIASAKRTVFEPKPKKTFQCRVCNDPGASDESEGLCWVCRRLKISAWREVEVQLPMAE